MLAGYCYERLCLFGGCACLPAEQMDQSRVTQGMREAKGMGELPGPGQCFMAPLQRLFGIAKDP